MESYFFVKGYAKKILCHRWVNLFTLHSYKVFSYDWSCEYVLPENLCVSTLGQSDHICNFNSKTLPTNVLGLRESPSLVQSPHVNQGNNEEPTVICLQQNTRLMPDWISMHMQPLEGLWRETLGQRFWHQFSLESIFPSLYPLILPTKPTEHQDL